MSDVVDWSPCVGGDTLSVTAVGTGGKVTLSENGAVIASASVGAEGISIRLPVVGDDVWQKEADETVSAVSKASRELLKRSTGVMQQTTLDLDVAFRGFRRMAGVTFTVGIAAFIAAVVKGFLASSVTDVVVTALFGGLSATTFVATFIAQPTRQMSDAGPRTAWVQAIIATYWSKLAYMSDPKSALTDLDDAQQSLARAMQAYFASGDSAVHAPLTPGESPSPATPVDNAGGAAAPAS